MEHEFDLLISGHYEDFPDDVDAAVQQHCPDAVGVGISNCDLIIGFCLESETLLSAVLSAIGQVESLGIGLKVERLEPDELVGLSDIGRRIGMTREAVRLYANGQRGAGGFPRPVATPSKNARVWKWLAVVNWFTEHGIADVTEDMAQHAGTVATINAALELRKHIGTQKALTNLWKDLQTPAVSKP